MPESRLRRRPVRSAAALITVLAITTGWVQAASRFEPVPARSLEATRGADIALAADKAGIREAPGWKHLVSDRSAEAALIVGARPLLQARQLAVRLPEPARVAAPAPAPVVKARAVVKATVRAYSGTNHVWIPSLGISRPVYLFPCTRSRPPDNLMYRWGCAGRNNLYLLGHAWGVMKPLHDAYTSGRLRLGMIAIYADGNGRIRSYRVTEWRVVDPVDAAWAKASQPVPSMTLQTCVGPNGSLRLNVRLVAVD
ncbi:MAG: hypothetical protein HYX55_11025 [Chloroflexi bacterium]|nr:hypothetical protein [Chloroflexota bacterium]